MGLNRVTAVGCLCGALALCGYRECPPVAAAKDMVVVAETQLYPVREQERGYLGRYADLPLLFDYRTSRETMYEGGRYSQADFEAYQRVAQSYGIDGFSYFAFARPSAGLAATRSPVRGFATMPILSFTDRPDRTAHEIANVRQTMANPDSIRIGGKVLLISYWDFGSPDPAKLAGHLERLRAAVGDGFLYLQEIVQVANFRYRAAFRAHGRLEPGQVEEYKAHLRGFLRVADGVLLGEALQMTKIENDVRVFDEGYFAHMLRLTRETLSEPGFEHKLLGVCVMNGHENAYTRGYTLSHDGTRTLRKMLKCARDAEADVLNLFEWDEWNENTSFLPTLDNSFATKRIVREFMDRVRGRRPAPLEGDDVTRPNLIVTSRKAIAPGEHFFVEVLNVPDGSWTGPLRVRITLADESGRTIREFAERTLDAAALDEARFGLPVEGALAAARAVRIRLDWRSEDGRSGSVTDGLSPVSVAMGESWMVKAVKQPIRDLAPVEACRFERTNDGRLSVSVSCRDRIRYVMLSENGLIEYIRGAGGKESRFRESEDAAVFAVTATAWRKSGAKGATLKVPGDADAEWLKGPFAEVVRGESCRLDGISVFAPPTYLRIPKATLASARLEIDGGDLFRGEIPLAAAYGKGAYAVGGSNGVEFTAARFNRQAYFPPELDVGSCAFTIRPDKSRASSAYHLTVVTMDGKTWRSRPVVDEPSPSARAHDLEWDFSPAAGDVIVPKSGERRWFGMAGAEHAAANLQNRGPTVCGAIEQERLGDYLKTASDAHPRRERQADGSWALVFDGTDDYVGFPHETLPQFGSYALTFEVQPLRDGTAETIAGASGEGGGSLCWITRTDKGELTLDFMGLRFEHTSFRTGLRMPKDAWSSVRIEKQPDELVVTVNGTTVRKPCCHPGRNPSVFSLGGVSGRPFFKGKIRNLAVKGRVER